MWNLHRLFQNHARELNRFFRRRGHNAETASDLTQDTFVRVLSLQRHRQTAIRAPICIRSRAICRPTSIGANGYSSGPISPKANGSGLPIIRQRLKPSSMTGSVWRLSKVRFWNYQKKTRKAFEMHRLDEKTIAEVASELDLSVSRTWMLIKRAYLHLRARLKEDSSF